MWRKRWRWRVKGQTGKGETEVVETEKVKRKSNNPAGRPATLSGTEQWMMRVNPRFRATLMRKAKDWGVSSAELVRLVVQQGFEEELFEPPAPGETVRDRLKRSARGEDLA